MLHWCHNKTERGILMKKKFTTILSTAIVFMILCSFQTLAVTREEALDYAKSKIGTVVGSGQCVAYAKDYYKAVFGESVWGNGSDYINNVPDGFTQYLYGDDNWDPQPGDIVSWSWNKYGGRYGHVGIISRTDANGFFYLNQNPYPVKESYFTYGESGWTLAGVVRPPFEDDMVVENVDDAENAVNETLKSLMDGVMETAKNTAAAVQAAARQDLDSGSHAIISAASGKRMNIYVDKIAQATNGTAITLYKAVDGNQNDTQMFTFRKSSDNTYLIQPRNSKYTVNVSARKAGSKLICWTSTKKNNEEWIVERNGDGYTFRLENQQDLYLTQSGDTLKLQKKSGKTNQIFYID